MAISYKTYMQGSGTETTINAAVDTTSTVLYPVLVAGSGSSQAAKVSHATSNKFALDASTGALTITGAIKATSGVDKLTTASGSVNLSTAAAPVAGQSLVATSATTATWQTQSTTGSTLYIYYNYGGL